MTPVRESTEDKVELAEVEVEPNKGKPILTSKVGLTAVTQGAGAIAVGVTQAAEIKDQTTRLLDGLNFDATPVILGGMCIAGIVAAIWFIWDRRNKAKEYGA